MFKPFFPQHRPGKSLSSPQAQDQPQTPYTIHHLTALGLGAKVQTETVLVHRRTSRILQLPHPHRDPGEDLVPEPTGQGQASARGRAGKAQTDCQTCPAPQFQSASSSWDPTSFGGLTLWPVVPLPEAFTACCSSGAVWNTFRVQHVSPRMSGSATIWTSTALWMYKKTMFTITGCPSSKKSNNQKKKKLNIS